MEQFILSVLFVQILCALGALIPLIILWWLERWLSAIALVLILIVTCFGFSFLPALFRELYGFEWFRNVIRTIAKNYPYLVQNSDVMASWSAFVAGAIFAWVILVFSFVMRSPSRILRGSELLPESEMVRKLRSAGRAKIAPGLGQYYLPSKLENRSMAIFGEPGSGKTQLILGFLHSIRHRSDRVVSMDVGGEICKKLAMRGDQILSVNVEGSQQWSPFSEIENLIECAALASALISSGVGEARTWNGYARELLTVFLSECWRTNQRTNRELNYYIKIASTDELRVLVHGTSAQRLFEAGNERMLGNVQSILSQNLSFLDLLDPDAGEDAFSLRRWIQNHRSGGWLWIVYDDLTKLATAQLRAAWIEILARSALGLPESSTRNVRLILDELAANGKIDVLMDALARGRKYGLSLMLGIQNIHQLYSIYGKDEALSILGSAGLNVILRTPDPETSDYLSRTIGDAESVREQTTTNSQGSSSIQKLQETKRTVLPSEISSLPDLVGFIKFADIGWGRLRIPLIRLKNRLSLTIKQNSINGSDIHKPSKLNLDNAQPLASSVLDEI
ncbi:type IV secretion system DNA-binding domain-containing protein [Cellvibrio sp. NN19]|uniref:type IV secretion system DNA-binding domain-containing protein n=1 Tax=Cellvibrio chitinivorans TaxID=3102792 RepID=UPI002B411907|nr:type IV secretion system DNA-binding domain-containing protein [Cellvibrio sp. NN19]